MRNMLRLCSSLALVVFAAGAHAATWHVVPGGGGDAVTIQGGINLASNGDIVTVAPGTYTGTGNINVDFLGKNITVKSDDGPYTTIIDCMEQGPGFKFQNGEDGSASLQGFTIRNARGNRGAAIFCDGASPMISYNIISGCYAFSMGGGIYAKNGSPYIFNNTLDNNGSPTGGAIGLATGSSAQIFQNIMCACSAGGAIACSGATPATFIACNDIYSNTGGDAVCIGNAGHNFSVDPMFCGMPGTGNYYLQQISPCTQSFSPCASFVGALGVQCEVTRTQTATWGQVKSMYR